MLCAIIENILASAICAFIVACGKRFYRYLKTPIKKEIEQAPAPKSVIKKQFFVSLAAMAISFTVTALLPQVRPFTWQGLLKVFLFITNGYSVIFAWGAFEAALAFHPTDEPTGDPEADHHPDDAGSQ